MDIAKYWTHAQELNWRHGLFRIWIAASVIWCGLFTLGGVYSYIDGIKSQNKSTNSGGLFSDIPITNPQPVSWAPSSETVQYFILAFSIPVLVIIGCKLSAAFLSWIYGGFKSEEAEGADYVGFSKNAFSKLGLWSFRVLLYAFASTAIASLSIIATIKTHEWLLLPVDGSYGIMSPFILFALLLQFAAFKWIFFKDAKKGTAFLAYAVVSIVAITLITAIAVMA